MANLRTSELGRHRWVEGSRQVRGVGHQEAVLKCSNCARIHDWLRGDPPVVGCISDLDLTRLGSSGQKDQLDRDIRGGLYS